MLSFCDVGLFVYDYYSIQTGTDEGGLRTRPWFQWGSLSCGQALTWQRCGITCGAPGGQERVPVRCCRQRGAAVEARARERPGAERGRRRAGHGVPGEGDQGGQRARSARGAARLGRVRVGLE